MLDSNRLTFATQGDEYSYHAEAARRLAGDDIDIDPHRTFSPVVRASRNYEPGLGIIAICTVAGTVEDSAREIVKKRVSALPPIVARVDLPVKLALIGAYEMSQEEIAAQGVRLLAQKAAYLQCEEAVREIAPYIKLQYAGESVEAVREALRRSAKKSESANKGQHPFLAIGPAHAAEPLGGVIVGPEQVNPIGSVTSFYALQRDEKEPLIPIDPEKISPRTVVSLAHPDKPGEFEKAMAMTEAMGIQVGRFIPFNIGDFTKHDPSTRRGGGILEIMHQGRDEEVSEWISRVEGIESNDGFRGPFDINRLGAFDWYVEDPIDLGALAAQREEAYAEQRRAEAFERVNKLVKFCRQVA
jgi:prephenate dehydratase